MVNLENDILSSLLLQKKAKDRDYAIRLYCTLCNLIWVKDGEEWSGTWRYNGGLVAELRDQGEDYLDFYCSGLHDFYHEISENCVDPEVEKDLGKLGWTWKEYKNLSY